MSLSTKQQSPKGKIVRHFCSCGVALYKNTVYVPLSKSLGNIVYVLLGISQSDYLQG